MGKTYEATTMKCKQFKSKVVINDKSQTITTFAVPKELPAIEDVHIAVKNCPKTCRLAADQIIIMARTYIVLDTEK
jgi:hypothetical protein